MKHLYSILYSNLLIAKNNEKHEFSSTQFYLPKQLTKNIIKWGKDNITNDNLYTEKEKYGRENEIHITVKYGLHTSKDTDIEDVVKNFGSLKLILGEVTRFRPSDKDYEVVKIDVNKTNQLQKLYNLLTDELENTTTYDEYRPHVTIAYIKPGTCNKLSGDKTFVGESFIVDELCFSSKNGEKTQIKLI